MSLQIQDKVDLSKYIDTRLMGERPHIRGRRLPVSFIAANAAANRWNIQELAYEFTLSEEQVLAALLYYREHKTQIDAQDATEQQLWEQLHDETLDS
jgi:uncharacterized protein (DUF433 family)